MTANTQGRADVPAVKTQKCLYQRCPYDRAVRHGQTMRYCDGHQIQADAA